MAQGMARFLAHINYKSRLLSATYVSRLWAEQARQSKEPPPPPPPPLLRGTCPWVTCAAAERESNRPPLGYTAPGRHRPAHALRAQRTASVRVRPSVLQETTEANYCQLTSSKEGSSTSFGKQNFNANFLLSLKKGLNRNWE